MENQPQNIIAIGRKRFPIEEIALVEPFEPPAEQPPRFTSDKDFKARVVLIDRYNVLTEDTVESFAEANKFRRLPTKGPDAGPCPIHWRENPSANTPEEVVLNRDRSAQLRICVARMSRDHREILDLVYYQEKSVEEVAEVIQMPKSTVKTRMFYARKRLAQLLSAHRDFDHLTASRAA
jgi:RNA polymerase sigma factor (sigma-70 family)